LPSTPNDSTAVAPDNYAEFGFPNRFLAKLALDFIDSGFPGELRVRRNQNGDILDLAIIRYQDCRELTTEEDNETETFSPSYWTERLDLNRVTSVRPDRVTGVKASDLTQDTSPDDTSPEGWLDDDRLADPRMGADQPSFGARQRNREERLRGVGDPDPGEYDE